MDQATPHQCSHWLKFYKSQSEEFQEKYYNLRVKNEKLVEELKRAVEYGEVMRDRSIMEFKKSKASVERIGYLLSSLRMTHDNEIRRPNGMYI